MFIKYSPMNLLFSNPAFFASSKLSKSGARKATFSTSPGWDAAK